MTAVAVHHMAISCQDPLAIERFYSTHFGFTRARVVPLGADQIVFIKSGDVYLDLFQAKGEAPGPPAGGTGPEYPAWRHLAFKVDDVAAKLAAMGDEARITAGPMDFDAFIPGWRTVGKSMPNGGRGTTGQ